MRGGSVPIFIHNNVKHSLIESLYWNGNNNLWIHVNTFALDIRVVYNSGDTNMKTLLEDYEKQLRQRKHYSNNNGRLQHRSANKKIQSNYI